MQQCRAMVWGTAGRRWPILTSGLERQVPYGSSGTGWHAGRASMVIGVECHLLSWFSRRNQLKLHFV